MKNRKFFILLLIVIQLTVLLPERSAHADDTGLWVAGGACSLVYTPLKTGLFLLFGVTGALSYLGTIPARRTDISEEWMSLGFYGDWLIRPDHLRGQSAPKFVSREPEVHFIH